MPKTTSDPSNPTDKPPTGAVARRKTERTDMTNRVKEHRQQVAKVERDLLPLHQRINDVAVKAVVTEAHRQGNSLVIDLPRG